MLALYIRCFALENEDMRFEIARSVFEKDDPTGMRTCCFYLVDSGFNISSMEKRIELAEIMSRNMPYAFCEDIAKFEIHDGPTLLRLAQNVAQSNPAALAGKFGSFRIDDEKERAKLTTTLVDQAPLAVASNMDDFNIVDEEVRIKLARTLANSPGAGRLVHMVESFNISNNNVWLELARGMAKNAPIPCADFFLTRDKEVSPIKDEAALKELRLDAYISALSQFDKEYVQNKFARYDKCLGDLSKAASTYGKKHQIFQTLEESALKEANTHVRDVLLDWTYHVALRFRLVPDKVCDQVAPRLTAIQAWRAPEQRDPLTRLLAEECIKRDTAGTPGTHGTPSADDFLAFVDALPKEANFKQAHTVLLPLLLFPLFGKVDPLARNAATRAETLKSLANLLGSRDFKNVRNRKPVITGLLNMAEAKHLSPDIKQGLLAAAMAAPQDAKLRDQVAQLVGTTPFLGSLASLNNEAIHQMLVSVGEGKKPLDAGLSEAMQTLFQLDDLSDPDAIAKFKQQFQQYQNRSRAPNALIAYAAKVHTELAWPDKDAVLDAIHKFVRTAVLDSEQAFRALRYDTAGSVHLENIATNALPQWESRQQECVFSPPNNFLSQATVSETARDFSKWTIVDTDAPEDLLLCGTEVVGSCQNLYSDIRLSKAILGYVMDGKYRMVAVKSQDGKIQARAMLRLLWSDGKPVLHLEEIYENAGVPAQLSAALVELAKQKAKAIGCALVTHAEDAYETVDDYPGTLHSYRNPWPFEYVDSATTGGLRAQGDPYTLTDARLIAPA